MGKSIKVNETYNYLKVIELIGRDKHGRKLFKCKCLNCGKNTIKRYSYKTGKVKSCGCLRDKNF